MSEVHCPLYSETLRDRVNKTRNNDNAAIALSKLAENGVGSGDGDRHEEGRFSVGMEALY